MITPLIFLPALGILIREGNMIIPYEPLPSRLKPNGIFVLDYLNVHYAEDHLVHKSEKQIDDINYYITKWFDETHFYKKIVVEDDELDESIRVHRKKWLNFL